MEEPSKNGINAMLKGIQHGKKAKENLRVLLCPGQSNGTMYLNLWKEWATNHKDLMVELHHKVVSHGGMLSDRFANTDINQARALAQILNEALSPEEFRTVVTHAAREPLLAQITKLESELKELRKDRACLD